MRNVHIIPTDKPSRLYIGDNGNFVFGMIQTSIQSRNNDFTNQNIYITSDEEIKEGDWGYAILSKQVFKNVNPNLKAEDKKKIILTTDQDLIKDGVQAINDNYIEWFVKNPSCESVVVIKEYFWEDTFRGYSLRLPQEEPKQETVEEVSKVERSDLYNKIHSIVKQIPREDVETDAMDASSCAYDIEQFFYKWQQERSYSEKNIKQFAFECVASFLSNDDNKVEIKLVDVIIDRLNDKFEQFKKK